MENKLKWIELIHLGSNLWHEEGNTQHREHRSTPCASPESLFNRECWNKHTEDLRNAGVDTLIIDVAEALKYESHPEINVKNSWDHATLKAEINRLRRMGFELIPKLNFSACHDVWLGYYSRMLSTPIYYKVCKDLIDEVASLFESKHFHIGMADIEVWHHTAIDRHHPDAVFLFHQYIGKDEFHIFHTFKGTGDFGAGMDHYGVISIAEIDLSYEFALAGNHNSIGRSIRRAVPWRF